MVTNIIQYPKLILKEKKDINNFLKTGKIQIKPVV